LRERLPVNLCLDIIELQPGYYPRSHDFFNFHIILDILKTAIPTEYTKIRELLMNENSLNFMIMRNDDYENWVNEWRNFFKFTLNNNFTEAIDCLNTLCIQKIESIDHPYFNDELYNINTTTPFILRNGRIIIVDNEESFLQAINTIELCNIFKSFYFQIYGKIIFIYDFKSNNPDLLLSVNNFMTHLKHT